jgi:hypothetical protein
MVYFLSIDYDFLGFKVAVPIVDEDEPMFEDEFPNPPFDW